VTTPINDPTTPHTVEGLLRVVEERDAEVVLLKLMVDKLKLQLLRSLRARGSDRPASNSMILRSLFWKANHCMNVRRRSLWLCQMLRTHHRSIASSPPTCRERPRSIDRRPPAITMMPMTKPVAA
jgi:hypothetical protein